MWLGIVAVLQCVFLRLCIVWAYNQTAAPCRKPIVEVVVSPLTNSSKIRSLILTWMLETISQGDTVSLHRGNVNSRAVFTTPVTAKTGWVDTGVQETRDDSYSLPFTEQCLGYWAVLKDKSSKVIASSCLETAPRWMEKNMDSIKDMKLKDMFLPGTHDSGAHRASIRPFNPTMTENYLFTQDERIIHQLIYGIRVLDLRTAHYPDNPGGDVWWINHDVFRLRPLHVVLDEIKEFVNNTKEIVIMDFHNFPVGFNSSVHHSLIKYLEDFFKDYLAPASLGWDAPLSKIWDGGRRLLLAYNSGDRKGDYAWSGVSQKWGDVRNNKDLKDYLKKWMDSPPSQIWSAMAELTANAGAVITGSMGSLRDMASRVNPDVTEWFRGDWGSKCNIVSVDFFRGTGIVKAAQEWNLRRANGSKCDLCVCILK